MFLYLFRTVDDARIASLSFCTPVNSIVNRVSKVNCVFGPFFILFKYVHARSREQALLQFTKHMITWNEYQMNVKTHERKKKKEAKYLTTPNNKIETHKSNQ